MDRWLCCRGQMGATVFRVNGDGTVHKRRPVCKRGCCAARALFAFKTEKLGRGRGVKRSVHFKSLARMQSQVCSALRHTKIKWDYAHAPNRCQKVFRIRLLGEGYIGYQ